jgi:hypothetical protein
MIRPFRRSGVRRGAGALAVVPVLAVLAAGAQAAPAYTVQVTQNADLGTITSAASGDTVFRVDPSTGTVTTPLGGTATRSSNGATRATVTISCAASVAGDCTKTVNVKLQTTGSGTGRARPLSRLTFWMGTAVPAGAPPAPGSLAFTIAAIGPNSSKTFFVGADMTIAADNSGLPTGMAEADFSALADESPNTPSTGAVGRLQAIVIRSIAIAKTSDLVFGRVVKPQSGAGSVTIDATTGARTMSGADSLDSPTPSRAAFNVTGEGGQMFSVTVPATFTMTGPTAMVVTTSSSVGGTAMLSSTLGSAGSLAFGVGGSAPINASTLNGDYSGSFTVTVAYN